MTPGELVSFRTGDGVRLNGFVVDRRPPGNGGGTDMMLEVWISHRDFSEGYLEGPGDGPQGRS